MPRFSQYDVDALTFRDKNALSAVLQKIDRILSDAPVTVDFFEDEFGMPQEDTPPSWVIGSAISLSSEVVAEYQKNSQSDAEFMVSVLGLNYHELSHVLYTPQRPTQVANRIEQRELHKYYNALEDQRIENMFCAEYSNAHHHFTFAVLTHVVNGSPGNAFPLVYGRKYLPKRVRRSADKAFTGSNDLKKRFKVVIDKYIDIPYPEADPSYAVSLVVEYRKLLQEWSQGHNLPDDAGTSECQNRQYGSGDSWEDKKQENEEEGKIAERSQQAQEKRAETEDNSDDDEGEENETGSGESSGSESDESKDSDTLGDSGASGESDESSESESEGDATGSEGEPTDAQPVDTDGSDSETAEGESDAAGTTPDTPAKKSDGRKSVRDIAKEEIDNVLNDPGLKREVQNTSESYQKHRKQLGSSTRHVGDDWLPISNSMRTERNNAKREIGKILDTVAPGWVYGSHAGVINVPRYIQSEHGDEDIWDSWDEGREEDIGCEVFIGLDASGSMETNDRIGSACAALWIMKSAFDELNIDTLVTNFGDPKNERVLYGRGERVHPGEYLTILPEFVCTVPNTMLEVARDVMADSTKKSKLFIAITDGHWSDARRSAKCEPWQPIIREMGDVTKMLISVEMQPEQATADEFNHVYNANSSNLVALGSSVRDVVLSTVRGKVR